VIFASKREEKAGEAIVKTRNPSVRFGPSDIAEKRRDPNKDSIDSSLTWLECLPSEEGQTQAPIRVAPHLAKLLEDSVVYILELRVELSKHGYLNFAPSQPRHLQ